MCSDERLKTVEEDVKLIMNNHLPHIREDVRQNRTELRIYGAIIMIALAAILKLLVI